MFASYTFPMTIAILQLIFANCFLYNTQEYEIHSKLNFTKNTKYEKYEKNIWNSSCETSLWRQHHLNITTYTSAEAHIIVNDLSFVKKGQISLTWHVSGMRRCEKARRSPTTWRKKSDRRHFRNVIRENNAFIRCGKWRASRLTRTK